MSKKKKKTNDSSKKQFEKKNTKIDSTNIKNVEKKTIEVEKQKKINDDIDKQVIAKKINVGKSYKHPLVHSFLILVLLTSLAYFIISLFFSKNSDLSILISCLLLTLFTIIFVSVSITTNRKNKSGFFFSSFILFSYFIFSILNSFNIVNFPIVGVDDFTGKDLTEVIEWSEKNSINVLQSYEYSDLVPEYHIISQDIKVGTKLKEVKELTVSVSEGPNPYKEILVPNMVSWDSERVLDFVKDNHLSNVHVDFIESAKPVNTVVEQNKSGNMKRDEELKLILSYGEELLFSEVKLKDLTNMTKFEAMFYLKQNHLNYEFKTVFSDKIKKGKVVSQNIKPGKMVKIDDEKIIVSISKGPKIKVPDLTKMSMTEVTEWIIKNKLKLEFSDSYDDSVKENSIISANYKANDEIAEGDLIKVVISRGKLKMGKFENFNEFREWADKYKVPYEEQYEFNDNVKAGDIIRFSYNEGDTIKNNDSIIIVISNGKETVVPNIIGLTKNQAASKLKDAGFNYNYVYGCSNSTANGKVVRQSLRAGSKASENTTVTVTISTGKCVEKPKPKPNPTPTPRPPQPTCDRSKGDIFFVASGNVGSQVLEATKRQNKGFTITASFVDRCPNGSTTSGSVCNTQVYDNKWISFCDRINLVIVR